MVDADTRRGGVAVEDEKMIDRFAELETKRIESSAKDLVWATFGLRHPIPCQAAAGSAESATSPTAEPRMRDRSPRRLGQR